MASQPSRVHPCVLSGLPSICFRKMAVLELLAGVAASVGPDGRRSVTTVRKLRVIDDAKQSRQNDLQLHCKTIHLYDFTYSGLVAQELVEQCRARSWKFNGPPPMTGSSRASKRSRRGTLAQEPRDFDVPQLVFGCEDLTSAFRL